MQKTQYAEFLAEAIGTYILVFVAAGVVCTDAYVAGGIGIVGVAIANAFVLAAVITAFGHVSGAHINPAVTLSILILGDLPPVRALAYVVSQLLGATAAGATLLVVFGTDLWDPVALGTPLPGVGVATGTAVLVETVLTFFWVIVVLLVAVDARAPDAVYGIAIAAIGAAGVLLGGPVSGAAMNPARAFGPAVASGVWTSHWVYWVGPLAGAVLASVVFTVLRDDSDRQAEELFAEMLQARDEDEAQAAASEDDGKVLRLVDEGDEAE